MKTTRQDLTAAILHVRERLVASGRQKSFQSINSGYCGCFCSDVMEHLEPGGSEDSLGMFELGIDNLMLSENDEPTVMDRDLIGAHWPRIRPPEGMDWDDVDAMAAMSSFSSGTHVWLCMDGRHYDSEAPEGVDNPFDLPFFQRIAEHWMSQRAAPRP